MTEVKMVWLADIQPSKTNPRKNFNAEKLKELQESIASKGLVSPLLVRPVGKTGDEINYELVAGERRLRCCQALKIEVVPCLVRILTDEQALELQIIENLQRDDLDPIEEAEGYRQLMELGAHSAKDIAAKVHREVKYIYRRLKLLLLPELARQALLDGRLDVSRAREIACLPHEEWRIEATKIVLNPEKYQEILADAGVCEEYGDAPKEITHRQTTELLTARYMRELKSAPFDPKDGTLVPAAGPCATCPKRAGNAPELYPNLREDMCTDLKCFGAKVQATQDRLATAAKAKGMTVLSAADGKKLFSKRYDGTYHLTHGAGYVDPGDTPGYDIVSDPQKAGKWKSLVKGKEVPIVVAFDETGAMHELMDRKLAVTAAKANKPEVFRQRETSSGNAEMKKQEEQRKLEQEIKDVAFSGLMDELVQKIEKDKLEKSLGLIFGRCLVDYALDLVEAYYSDDIILAVLTRRGVQVKEEEDSRQALEKYLKTFKTPQSLAAIAMELLLTNDQEERNGFGDQLFAKAYKIDRKKIEDQARIDVVQKAKKYPSFFAGFDADTGKGNPGMIGQVISEALNFYKPAEMTAEEIHESLVKWPHHSDPKKRFPGFSLQAVKKWLDGEGKKWLSIKKIGKKWTTATMTKAEIDTPAKQADVLLPGKYDGQGPLGDAILTALAEAAPNGLRAQGLAKKIKFKELEISAWLTKHAKGIPDMKEVGKGSYFWGDAPEKAGKK